jgi:hypothetical protein
MPSASEAASSVCGGWRKLAALLLALAAVGLPVNDVGSYVLLLVATVVIFSGETRASAGAWAAAIAIVAVAVAGQFLLAPPRIEEGHNVFLPGGPGALERGLPAEVYRHMAEEFDAQYPPAQRCNPDNFGCWQNNGFPDSAFAFSADGIFHKSTLSRSVTGIDFSDPVWLRLGFVNEVRYNWTADTDVRRGDRDCRFWMGWRRWHLAMPWYEMIRLPAAFVGGELCWRGEVMWESAGEHFARWPGDGCRTIEPADAGRRIFGIAIKPDTLAMRLTPPWSVRLPELAVGALAVVAVLAMLGVLVRLRTRHVILPVILIVLALLVISIDDASFLGGVRPYDGGDDGLFYDGVGRIILQKLLAGDIWSALEGGEKVFYYGGPGLRYFRALEHIVFGENYLGYLSLILLLPFLVHGLFRRFLPDRWALALILLFVAVPVGALFGTSFVDYAKWAARGFADPAAYILFIAALLPLLGAVRDGPRDDFAPAFFGALLFALATIMKPLVAPAVAVMLGGAGLAALYHRQWRRLASLCIGFLPVFAMALHNYVFGGVFVLFSANVGTAAHTPMQPSAYIEAAQELFSADVGGAHVRQGVLQLMHWLAGPSQLFAMIPLHVAAIAILLYGVGCRRGFDPWLRLIALAALVQHVPALFYAPSPRYYFLAWLLTALVCVAWVKDVGLPLLRSRHPLLSQRAADHPLTARLAFGLLWLQKISA